jgi:genome maintenance exonuclease 1
MFKHELLEKYELESITTNAGRFYTTPDGKKYPSVTTVIGSYSDKTWLWEWQKRVGKEKAQEITNRAAVRGTAVHKMFEKYLMNDADFAHKVMPFNKILFDEMRSTVDQRLDTVYGVEHPLYSHRLRTAGRTDVVAKFDGIPSIVDFKTASRPKDIDSIRGYFQQATCYALMVGERHTINIPQIVVLICTTDDGPQVFVQNTIDYVQEVVSMFKNHKFH